MDVLLIGPTRWMVLADPESIGHGPPELEIRFPPATSKFRGHMSFRQTLDMVFRLLLQYGQFERPQRGTYAPGNGACAGLPRFAFDFANDDGAGPAERQVGGSGKDCCCLPLGGKPRVAEAAGAVSKIKKNELSWAQHIARPVEPQRSVQ